MVDSVAVGIVKVLGLFATVGVGLGLSGALVIQPLVGEGGPLTAGFLVAQALVIFFFSAPIVGAIAGVYSMIHFDSREAAVQVGTWGSVFGFYLMFLGAFFLLSASGVGPDPSYISDNLIVVVAASIPAGVVGGVIPVLG
jgi:hypothetical protein